MYCTIKMSELKQLNNNNESLFVVVQEQSLEIGTIIM